MAQYTPNQTSLTQQYNQIREKNEKTLANHKAEIYAKIPEIEQIEHILRQTASKLVGAILDAPIDTDVYIAELEEQNIFLQEQKTRLLLENGYPADYLNLQYDCPFCKDTGVIDTSRCNCYKQKQLAQAYHRSNLSYLIGEQSFEQFNLELFSDAPAHPHPYSARASMQKIVNTVLQYLKDFENTNQNLLFMGPPGTGKTFLSSSIAKELLDTGKSVLYLSSYTLTATLTDARFNRLDPQWGKEQLDQIFTSDFLIVDDLGSEHVHELSNASLFELINTRLVYHRKMLFNTNLSLPELHDLYGERITSRIMGEFKCIQFIGEDLRIR